MSFWVIILQVNIAEITGQQLSLTYVYSDFYHSLKNKAKQNRILEVTAGSHVVLLSFISGIILYYFHWLTKETKKTCKWEQLHEITVYVSTESRR